MAGNVSQAWKVALIGALALSGGASAQDFNGDGFADLAVGAPFEDLFGMADAGAVTIIYGAGPGTGLSAFAPLPSVQITQATFGVEVIEAGDNFGASLAWGDFNGDLFSDLAIGAPGEDHPVIAGAFDAGMVIVLYGSPGGLIPLAPPLFTQFPPVGGPAVSEPAEPGDLFGWALAAGDFNADGIDDLSIGVPGENLGALVDCGIAHVLYGSPGAGLITAGPPNIAQSMFGFFLGDPTEPGDRFGEVLAAGDMNGDGVADLAFGIPFEDVGAAVDAGMVNVIYGLPGGGLTLGSPSEVWTQNTAGIPNVSTPGDMFGAALAIGNFDSLLGEDLAIGVPFDDVAAAVDAGLVHVIYSGGVGFGLEAFAPAPTANELWTQNTPGIPEVSDPGDNFGAALAAGNLNGDIFDDLAIGVPSEDVGGGPVVDAGLVCVIYGGPPGIGLDPAFATPVQVWQQNTPGIPEAADVGDNFGASLTVGDFDFSSTMDLVIGVPLEDVGGGPVIDAGCIHVLYSLPGLGLSTFAPIATQIWQQNTPGIPDANELGDGWGWSLDNDD